MNDGAVEYVVAPEVRYGASSRLALWTLVFAVLMLAFMATFTAIDWFIFHKVRVVENLIKCLFLSAVMTAIWFRKSVLIVGGNFIEGSYSVFRSERIRQDEVTQVKEIPRRFLVTGAGLLVFGKPLSLRRLRVVLVPASVANYEQIKARLMQWPNVNPAQ
ncbi:MAG: hypothetical protein LAO20_12015 [Acidobacteriia bacterium]|nr:hypothetical protein [Terriglobia bacterium]